MELLLIYRVFRIIFDTSDYLEFCTAHSYSTLHQRRDLLCRQFFQSVLDKSNCLNYLLPELRSDGFKDRRATHPFLSCPVCVLHVLGRLLLTMLLITMSDLVSFLKCLIIVSCRCSNERVNVFILYYWVCTFVSILYFCIVSVFCNPALGLQYY